MTNDTINDIINDAYDLAKGAATTPSIGIKSIARRLEELLRDKSCQSCLKPQPTNKEQPMMRNTKTTDQLNALVRLCNESIVEPSLAACNAQAIRAGLLELIADPLLRNPPFDKDAEEKMTRPEAVRILMQLQKLEAREGYVNIVRAYEMAIDSIVKRHRDDCRNRAKRRAAAWAAAAKEGK